MYFYLKVGFYIERRRDREVLHPLIWSREPGASSGLPTWVQGAKSLRQFPLLSREHWQGGWIGSEAAGFKLEPIWNASITSGDLAYYIKALAPCCSPGRRKDFRKILMAKSESWAYPLLGHISCGAQTPPSAAPGTRADMFISFVFASREAYVTQRWLLWNVGLFYYLAYNFLCL